jgi:hypothetical protein
MKTLLLSFIGLSFLLPLLASAETEEEEMARMQRELNARLFATEKKPEPPPPPVSEPVTQAAPAPASEAQGLPVSTFTGYRLAGVTLGMGKSDAVAKLQAEGYTCNMAQMQGMAAMLGRTICIYASMEAPKIAMFTVKNDQIRDFELAENYKTGFPEEIFKRAKQKFMGDYGSGAKCKSQRKGEVCEIFGHGYRITLRSETRGDDAKIIRSVHTM